MMEQVGGNLEEYKSVVLKSMRTIAGEHSLQGHQVPANVHLELEPWTKESGLLTASLKLARMAMRTHYRQAIATLYMEASPAVAPSSPEQMSRGAQFLSIVERSVGRRLDPSATLASQGLDSVALIQAHAVLRASGRPVSLERLSLHPICRICSWLDGAATETPLPDIDWAQEAALPPLSISTEHPPGAWVFLSGANGFLGVHIAARLAAQGSRALCMVRADSDQQALARFTSSASRYRLQPPMQNIRVVCGDLCADRFGWTAEQYAARCLLVGHVIHNGCRVNGVLPYRALREPNVRGTVRCLRLAADAGGASFLLVSSSSACGSLSSSRGYGSCKRVAELLTAAALPLLDTRVVRCGAIGASSQTGVTNDDFVNRLFRGLIVMKCAPICEQLVSLAPVDDVAEAIVSGPRQLLVSVCGTGGLTLGQIVAILNREFAAGIEEISYASWRFRLLTWSGPENPLSPLVSYFEPQGMPNLSDAPSAPQEHLCRPFDKPLFSLYVKMFQQQTTDGPHQL